VSLTVEGLSSPLKPCSHSAWCRIKTLGTVRYRTTSQPHADMCLSAERIQVSACARIHNNVIYAYVCGVAWTTVECRPFSPRHKPPIESTSRRQTVSLVATPVFRQAAASRSTSGLNRLIAKSVILTQYEPLCSIFCIQ